MSYKTFSDKRVDEAKDAIEEAIKLLRRATEDDCEGWYECSDERKAKIYAAISELFRVKSSI